MAAQPTAPADPRAIVRALEAAGVNYVVVGGWAVVTYGVDRATFDLDIVVAATGSNVSALSEALDTLDARRDLGAGITEEIAIDSPDALLAGPLRAITSQGPLDILTRVPGASFEDLRSDARRARFGDGTAFVIASKATLEQVKEAMAEQSDPDRAGRDASDLEALRRLEDPDLPPA